MRQLILYLRSKLTLVGALSREPWEAGFESRDSLCLLIKSIKLVLFLKHLQKPVECWISVQRRKSTVNAMTKLKVNVNIS